MADGGTANPHISNRPQILCSQLKYLNWQAECLFLPNGHGIWQMPESLGSHAT